MSWHTRPYTAVTVVVDDVVVDVEELELVVVVEEDVVLELVVVVE